MVILKEISLKNFKTFKDEQKVTFLHPLTAIIGSNGCGKSNLGDAIAFAMGARADNLRVTTMDQLVFRGIRTGQTKNMFVEAVFLNNDKSTVSFQRSTTGSVCIYRIDNDVVSHKFYLERLRELHIHPTAQNFIVFQNFVESSLTGSPKDRTAMFQEISGSCLLESEYKRLNGIITELQSELSIETKTRRKLMAEIKALRDSEKRRAEYMNLEKQHAVAEIHLTLFDLYRLERGIKDCAADVEDKTREIEEDEEKKSKLEQVLESAREKFRLQNSEIELIQERVTPMESKANDLSLGVTELQTAVNYARSRFASCRDAYNVALKADETSNKTIAEFEKTLKEIEREMEDYRLRNIERMDTIAENTESQIEEYDRLKKLFLQTFARDNERLIKLEREYEFFHDKFYIATIEKDKAKDALDRQIAFRLATKERSTKCGNALDKEKNELEKENGHCNDLSARLKALRKREVANVQTIERIDAILIDENPARKKIKRDAIVEEMRGHFSGIYGQLRNLCKPVDKSYELAMRRVFNPYMEYCLVDTMETATACIEFLKNQSLCVVSFLALDSLKVRLLDLSARNIDEPSNVKLLYDVVQFSPREIAKAVLYVTGNCLVCETSDLAAKIAFNPDKKNRYACVSREDGIYYRKNGIFSGGLIEAAKDAQRYSQEDLEKMCELKEESLLELRSTREKMPSREELLNANLMIKRRIDLVKWLDGDCVKLRSELAEEEKKTTERENDFDNAQAKWEECREAMEPALKAKEDFKSKLQAEESKIFADFCEKTGVANIQQYENGEEMYEKTFQELENKADLVKEELTFETIRDTKSKLALTKEKMDIAKQKLQTAIEDKEKNIVTLEFEKIKKQVQHLMSHYESLKKSMENLKSDITSQRTLLRDISRKLLFSNRQINVSKALIPRFKQKRHVILIEARAKGLKIPTINDLETGLSQNGHSDSYEIEDKIEFDYSKLPRDLLEVESSEVSQVRKELEDRIAEISSKMEEIGDPNTRATQQFNSAVARKKAIAEQIKATRKKLKTIVSEFDEVKEERQARFMKVFERVSNEIDIVYKKITGSEAAQAYLIPDNPEEPYLGGVHYQCVPPGKVFRAIEDLSGGEKALASMALICSNRGNDSAPFQILDEIDAALDDTNVEAFVKYIKNAPDVHQTIIITHKPRVLNAMQFLVRVLRKPSVNVPESKVITLDLQRYRDEYRSSRLID